MINLAIKNRFHIVIFCFLGRNFGYDRALEIIEDEEYLDDIDFDEIRRLRRTDTNYQLLDIVRKIGTFDNSVNVPKQKQNNVPNGAVPVQKYVKKSAQKSSNIIKKKGRPVPIPVRNERPNYRKSIPRMRVLKKPESYPYYRHKSRKKRQFEETDFLTYWSDLFNFANLGPGAYFSDSTYSGGNGLN